MKIVKDERPCIFVSTDYSPDEIRVYYEIPDALARRIQPEQDARTFAQCLAHCMTALDEACEPVAEDDDGFWDEDEELRT